MSHVGLKVSLSLLEDVRCSISTLTGGQGCQCRLCWFGGLGSPFFFSLSPSRRARRQGARGGGVVQLKHPLFISSPGSSNRSRFPPRPWDLGPKGLSSPTVFPSEKRYVLIRVLSFREVVLKTSNFHFTHGLFLIWEMIYQIDLLV